MQLLPDSQFLIYRDDLNHPTVSGNKLHKLKPSIEHACAQNYPAIASFGGPYSNHLHALAWACRQAGLNSIGFVRGELHAQLTPTLSDCQRWGMQLFPLARREYRAYQERFALDKSSFIDLSDQGFIELDGLVATSQRTLIVPEGGSNLAAIESVANAYRPLFDDPEFSSVTHAVCATGTGATMAGLRLAAPNSIQIIGVQAVAEDDATIRRVKRWLDAEPINTSVVNGHLGGFAKRPQELIDFTEQFEKQRKIPLDPIYTAKVFYHLYKMHTDGYFDCKDRILIIHTGGLQGKRGVI